MPGSIRKISSTRANRTWASGGLGAILLVLLPLRAAAQVGACHTTPECAELLARGQKESKKQSYEQALRDFQAAYARTPDPVLLVNIGRAYYRLGLPDQAIEFYLRFQGAVPVPEPQLVQTLDRYMLEARLLQEQRRQVPAAPPPVNAPPQPLYKKWWLWTIVGGTVAAGVAAGLAVRYSYPPFQDVRW